MGSQEELRPEWSWVTPWRLVWMHGGLRMWQRNYRRNDMRGTFTVFGPAV